MIEIKDRLTGKVMKTVKTDSLIGVNLSRARLNDADLSDTDLSNADLAYADLNRANLRGANLRFSSLIGANLRFANLEEADIRNAWLGFTQFTFSFGLHKAKGLETVRHEAPSSLDASTLRVRQVYLLEGNGRDVCHIAGATAKRELAGIFARDSHPGLHRLERPGQVSSGV